MQIFLLIRTDEDYRKSIYGAYSSIEKARDKMFKVVPIEGYDEDTFFIRNLTLDISTFPTPPIEHYSVPELREKIKDK